MAVRAKAQFISRTGLGSISGTTGEKEEGIIRHISLEQLEDSLRGSVQHTEMPTLQCSNLFTTEWSYDHIDTVMIPQGELWNLELANTL